MLEDYNCARAILHAKELVMSEAEVTELLVAIGDLLATYLGLWVTSTFAYLTVAYFTGAKLSLSQNIVVSILYFVASSSFALAAVGHTEAFIELYQREYSIYREISFSNWLHYYVPGFAMIFSFGTLMSLGFMYNIRRHVPTQPDDQ